MNTDVEDLLRESMERFTADVGAPAGLTTLVAQRRGMRLAHRSVAGAAAALAVGAVAAAAVVVPDALRHAVGQSAVDTAYVVKRVDSALSAAGPNAIAQMTITTRRAVTPAGKAVTITAQEWSYGNQWRSVVNSATGQPIYDEGFSSSSVFTLVSYLSREWAREPGMGRPTAPLALAQPARSLLKGAVAPLLGRPLASRFGGSRKLAVGRPDRLRRLRFSCAPVIASLPMLFQPGLPGIGFSASTVPGIAFSANSLPTARALRSAISCGILAEAGRQRVNGINAIELKSRSGSLISETIWVTPGTYLPVRVVIRSAGAPVPLQTANIIWLRPTAQNLAKLTVPIPAGYRRVTLPVALLSVLQQISGGPLNKIARLCLAGPAAQEPKQCAGFQGQGASGS